MGCINRNSWCAVQTDSPAGRQLYAFYAWQDDGDPSHILFRVQLPNLENDTFSVNLETNSNTSKLVDFGDGVKINLRYTSTSTNPITGVRTDTYNDGTLIIMRAANGSGYAEVARLPISPHEYETPGYTEFDITSYLVDGDNSLRIRVEDNVNGSISNNITFRSVIKTTLSLRNATSTTDLLTSLMFRYYISGNVEKTLHLILSDQAGHSDEFSSKQFLTWNIYAFFVTVMKCKFHTFVHII